MLWHTPHAARLPIERVGRRVRSFLHGSPMPANFTGPHPTLRAPAATGDSRREPAPAALAAPGSRTTDPISDSPMVGRFRGKIAPDGPPVTTKTAWNSKVGSGGQGRNRTIDTRIFSTTESPVRCEQVEDREGISACPTEPPLATEPIPNRNRENAP